MPRPLMTTLHKPALLLALAAISACSISQTRLDTYAGPYNALKGHKALFLNEGNDRFFWASEKGSQLDAIQLAQLLCTHGASEPEDCKLIYVDDQMVYDPVDRVTVPPRSTEVADVMYEAGLGFQPSHPIQPAPASQTPDGASPKKKGFFGSIRDGSSDLF